MVKFCCNIVLLIIIFHGIIEGTKLRPNGKNVCTKKIWYDGYVMKVSSYVGYENYLTCCGLFCWKKCQKSRQVQKTYLKSVKERKLRTIHECCDGWAPHNGECTIPLCKPACQHGTCMKPNICSCQKGYKGKQCSTEIDECQTTSGAKPVCDQICKNLPGSYMCSCKKGYQKINPRDPLHPTCINVNECSISQSLCQCSNPSSSCVATCHDSIGSYHCTCSKGYKLSGKHLCVDQNECSTNTHGCQHYCYNNHGKYSCGCKNGYTLNPLDGKTCLDIDECKYANGGCEQICHNKPGAYSCQCRKGFKLDADKRSCIDEDECSTFKPCDPTLGSCHNTRGSYSCSCKPGYQLDVKGVLCVDIDECLSQRHGCTHKCSNLIGSYQCICPIGYKLSWDRRTCEEINECKVGSHNCQHLCSNTVGSYTCKCRPGFQLNPDGRSCKSLPCRPLPDISHGKLTCPSTNLGAVCSYACNNGYRLLGNGQRQCQEAQKWSGLEERCEPLDCPAPYPPMKGQLVQPCLQKFGSRCVVKCNHGYHLKGTGFLECSLANDAKSTEWNIFDNTCQVIELCKPNPCQNHGRCIMTSLNDYKCDCQGTGYIGPICSKGIIQLPSFPTLSANKVTRNLIVEAKPSQEIVIKPVVPNGVIIFHPNQLKITYPNKQAVFRIESKSWCGRIRVDFELSGLDAPHFFTPRSTVIRVSATNHTNLNRLVSKDMLFKQCHPLKLDKCPSGEELNLYSSCIWNSNKQTTGHISVGTQHDFRVPFSIAGFSQPNFNNILSPRSCLGELNGYRFRKCTSSCPTHFTTSEYDFSIRNQHFTQAYLKQLSETSPWWFQVMVEPSFKGFDVNDFQSVIYRGQLPDNIPTCPNLPKINRTGIYSVFAIKTPLHAQFLSSQFNSHGIGTSCVVVDLCRRLYYLSLPMRRTIDATSLLNSIGFSNEQFAMSGLSMNTGAEKVSTRCMKIYDGDSIEPKNICVEGNIWAKMSVVKKRRNLFNLTFDGELVLDVENIERFGTTRLDESREVAAEGEMFFQFKYSLAGGKTTLQIADKNATVYKRNIGSSHKHEMVITTLAKHVRFVYDSLTNTFSPNKDEPFQMSLKYSLTGGSVKSVTNQAKIRSLLVYIHRSLDRIVSQLGSKGIKYVVTDYVGELSRNISLYTRQIQSAGYEMMLTKQLELQNKFVYLKEIFEDLKIKIQKDLPTDTIMIGRIEALERRLLSTDLVPIPEMNPIKENIHGFEIRYNGGLCIQKLCFRSCHVTVRFSIIDDSIQYVKCQLLHEEQIRRDVRLSKGTVVTINLSTQNKGAFDMTFQAAFSFFHQNVNGTVSVNQTSAIFAVRNFHVAESFIFDIRGEALVTSISTWESLTVLFHGESSQHCPQVKFFQNKMISFLHKNADSVSNKAKYYSDLFKNSTVTLKTLEKSKTKNFQNVLNLKQASDVATAEYKKSRILFHAAKERFKSYQVTTYLRDFEKRLDQVCKLKTCPERCLGTEICRVCQKPEIVKARILKCQNIKKKVRVTQEEIFDDACNKAIDIYKSIYTGTCRTGGDVSGLRAGIPNWTGGIGELIGGPGGAIIGALAGVVVGQFFEGCTDTWVKHRVREVQTVACKRTRFYTKEEEWIESKCNSFDQKVISEFGVPASCNCSTHCVMTQEPSCLENYNQCRNQRKMALKRMLQSAHVFNTTALEFMEFEKKLELWAKKKAAASLELVEGQLRYNQSLKDYNQAVKYAQMIHSSLLKLNNIQQIDVCLKNKWNEVTKSYTSNQPLVLNTIKFGPLSFVRKHLETEFHIQIQNQGSKSIVVNLNTYDIQTAFDGNILRIASQLLCQHSSTYTKSPLSPLLFRSNSDLASADLMCNRVLELYGFIIYPIESLDKLERSIRSKRAKIHQEIAITKAKLDSFKQANTEESKVDRQATQLRLNELKANVLRYSNENLLRMWRNDMERFAARTSVLVDRGVVDGLLQIGEEFLQLIKYSGVPKIVYYALFKTIRNGYTRLYFQEGAIKNLQGEIRTLMKILQSTLKLTRFCSQKLTVEIDQKQRVDKLHGDNVTLHCLTALSGHQNLKYTWYKNKEELSWEHQSKLSFQSRDSATYRCMVETAVLRNVSSEVYVNVESKPSITEPVHDISIEDSEEKDFTLFCNVTGSPTPSIQWQYKKFTDWTFTDINGAQKPVLKITKQNAKPGFYRCIASNKHGQVFSSQAKVEALKTCIARQAFRLSFTVPRNDVTLLLNKIFYSDDAKKAWSVSRTQRITLAITHHDPKSKVYFDLLDKVVNETNNGCGHTDRSMVSMVAVSKTNMVQLLRNVLKTMSVKTNENVTIAELREESRSTLLLEPNTKEFCPTGYVLHHSQYKCGKNSFFFSALPSFCMRFPFPH
ncbi:uncharacterized protein [Clytia hemisphaerica]|uniref:uncharacterized protein n=1 Tax=Clytia hemisphaerica TaxID=252671 RepID=UPI0034D6B654